MRSKAVLGRRRFGIPEAFFYLRISAAIPVLQSHPAIMDPFIVEKPLLRTNCGGV